MSVEIQVAEHDQKISMLEQVVSKIPNEINSKCSETLSRGKEYTDSKVREACLEMNLNAKEMAGEFKTEIGKAAKDVKRELKSEASTFARFGEWVFKAGLVAAFAWMAIDPARAIVN